jgi:predicted N-formylglutamate amidohydrolase
MTLLGPRDPPAFRVENPGGRSPFFLTADHAGRVVPAALGRLGLNEADFDRHIAWDIGIAGVTTRLAAALDATAIYQTYSRLVIDCNRQPSVASAFPTVSEATQIPGNDGLTEADRLVRRMDIFEPYHQEIRRLIAARGAGRTIYIAMHSFTPVYLGQRRTMDVALLYNRNRGLSKILLDLLQADGGFIVTENDPYRVSDETDYGVPVHAEAAGLEYAEIEIRQDLIENEIGQAEWASRLARLLPLAAEQLGRGVP